MQKPPNDVRQWIGFDEDATTTWLFDATFFSSSWTCIFGNGCKGIEETDATEKKHGCCSLGAHFADDDDKSRMEPIISGLKKKHWQLKAETLELGGPIIEEDGGYKTRIVDGACCFLNRERDGWTAGCALHFKALEKNKRPMDLKPEVCWQVPIRLAHDVDENGNETYTLREWRRSDWGEGGLDFHWWCTDAPEAFVSEGRVVDELQGEISALIGTERYDWLVDALNSMARPPQETSVWLPHPQLRPS